MVIATNAIVALSVLLGVSYHLVLPRRKTIGRAIWKVLPVLLLAVHAALVEAPHLLVLALALGALGDAFLAFDGHRAFVGGLVAFGLCHLAYLACIDQIAGPGFPGLTPGAGLAAALFVTAALAALAVVCLRAGRMAGPIAIYAVLIVTLLAFTFRIDAPWATVGAALFLFSDTLLALRNYVIGQRRRLDLIASHAVWLTYFSAQFLLSLALGAY